MMSDFGDIEEADVWDTDPTIDPLQVAMRVHRLRRELDVFVGDLPRPEWDELAPEVRGHGVAVATLAVYWIVQREPDNPALLARHIHEARLDVGDVDLPQWDDLSPSEQQIAIDLTVLILQWLEREGPR
jgi:hypothetical protein